MHNTEVYRNFKDVFIGRTKSNFTCFSLLGAPYIPDEQGSFSLQNLHDNLVSSDSCEFCTEDLCLFEFKLVLYAAGQRWC